jgi:hypothetical protein
VFIRGEVVLCFRLDICGRGSRGDGNCRQYQRTYSNAVKCAGLVS